MKNCILATAVVVGVLLTCLVEITSAYTPEEHQKYMKDFENRLHKLILKFNVTGYVIIGKVKGGCKGCDSYGFWLGGSTESNTPTTNKEEIVSIAMNQLPIQPPQHSTSVLPKADIDEEDYDNEIIQTDEFIPPQSDQPFLDIQNQIKAKDETLPMLNLEEEIQVPLENNAEVYYATNEHSCVNETDSDAQSTQGAFIKFEYMLLGSVFLYVTTVTLVYMIIFCRRPKEYHKGIASIKDVCSSEVV